MPQSQHAEQRQGATEPPLSTEREARRDVTEEGQRAQDMLSEGGGVVEPNVPVSDGSESSGEAHNKKPTPWARLIGAFRNRKLRRTGRSGHG